ncbi:unnamed protein product [Spirodela intermedia]|uniref:ACT domain-containing protein ACR n=1 Tax=Spirodela intermedia TaxID=51605 RepID=A0A7I8JF09_SPIIN|nr:unnamed protein product [Spirodela intermedia]CAA6668345.1 unnamed protein product [Spirodela intermedia]
MAWADQSRSGDAEDRYAELIKRMYTPSFVVDNESSPDFTIVKVEAKNNQGVLLAVVQVLADLNLVITKANISFDGEWSMDVFHVTAADGTKLQDEEILCKIQESLAAVSSSSGPPAPGKTTSIELIGADRPGLLSEISAVLKDVGCNVVEAEVWTHRATAAAVVRLTDEATGAAIEDPQRILTIRQLLCYILRGGGGGAAGKTAVSMGASHPQRRLHQMMSAERDLDGGGATTSAAAPEAFQGPRVSLSDCAEKGYSVVTLRAPDRPKLLFDALCALSDMDCVVFHATILTQGTEAWQEYYIRHRNGRPIGGATGERRRVVESLRAALELTAVDRAGLLCDVTRVLRENGLSVRRAEISSHGGEAAHRFFVADVSGEAVAPATLDSIRRQVAAQVGASAALRVKGTSPPPPPPTSAFKKPPPSQKAVFLLGSLLRACSPQSLRLIGSYS